MHISHALLALAPALGAAAPLLAARDGQKSAVDLILAALPATASCPADAPECRTAAQAAPFLIEAMQRYELYTYPEIAAVIALVGFESVNFRYKHNINNPTQGTSNQMTQRFIVEYAQSIPEIAPQVTAAAGDAAKLVDILIDDKYNFGSGPWFLHTKCNADVRSALQTTPDQGWARYMRECVGVDPNQSGRQEVWASAKKAFGIA